jgi:hypothetical protein
MYRRFGLAGSAASRTWKANPSIALAGSDSVLPPSVERAVQTALGAFARPRRVTKERCSLPSAPNATSGA